MLNAIDENALIGLLAHGLPRSPLQLNRLHEADAELIRMPDGTYLACTTDTIAEEIRSGLYADPRLAGWMAVMASLSDLAAVGAEPLGVLMAETVPPDASPLFLGRLRDGIADACRSAGTAVLGGDLNFGPEMLVTGCALGIVAGEPPLMRTGCRPGDLLFASGPLGRGNAFAYAVLSGRKAADFPYAPEARLHPGRLLRPLASACMDTSDGVIATLDQLMRLNGVGFRLDSGWTEALDPDSAGLFRGLQLPLHLLLAGQHGEFELLFTVPPGRRTELLEAGAAAGWTPLPLGTVTPEPRLTIGIDGTAVPVDGAAVRNAAPGGPGDLRRYMQALLAAFGADGNVAAP